MKFFGKKKAADGGALGSGSEPANSAAAAAADHSSARSATTEPDAPTRLSLSEVVPSGGAGMRQAAGTSRFTATPGGVSARSGTDYADLDRRAVTSGSVMLSSRYTNGQLPQPQQRSLSAQPAQLRASTSVDTRRHEAMSFGSHRASFGPSRMNSASRPGGYTSQSEDEACLSDAETGSAAGTFVRGAHARTSLPIMPRPSSAVSAAGVGADPQLGIIFLTYNGVTRKSLLPRSITSMDSVRALFLRTFPQLTVQRLESPVSKIYIHERMSNRFYILTHLSDVRDGIMLKLVDSADTTPVMKRSQSAYSSGSSRDSAYGSVSGEGSYRVQVPAAHRTTFSSSARETSIDDLLDGPAPAASHQVQQQQRLQSSGGGQQQTLHTTPTGNASAFAQYAQYIPPAGAGNDPRTRHSYAASTPTNHYGTLPRSLSKPSPASPGADAATWQQVGGGGSNGGGSSSSGGAGSSKLAVTAIGMSTDIDADAGPGIPEANTQHRMAKMESQIANLTAWVQTTLSRPSSAMSDRVSDASSASARSASTSTPQPEVNVDSQGKMQKLALQAKDLRTEVKNLRRIHQAQAESVRDTINDVLSKIKTAIKRVPGAEEYPIRAKRDQADEMLAVYKQDVQKLDGHLSELEKCVEKLKADVVNRRAHVDMAEVEAMAGHLITTSKLAADVKVKFPKIQAEMASAVSCEVQLITQQDQYLRGEPDRIDESIKRIRQLTLTLSTLRRLAGVQEHRTPVIPNMQSRLFGESEKNLLMGSIKGITPNHEQRQERVQAASLLLETKRALIASAEKVPFDKSMELTARHVKEAESMGRLAVDEGVRNTLQEFKATHMKDTQASGSSVVSTGAQESTQLSVPLRRGQQPAQLDRSKMIQNRDSVHWDADESDSEPGGPTSERSASDDPFIDVTEEPLIASAFSPIGKHDSLPMHTSAYQGFRGVAGSLVKPTVMQASTVDYVPVRDIGPSSRSPAANISRSVSASAAIELDNSRFESYNGLHRKASENENRAPLYEHHQQSQHISNGSTRNREATSIEPNMKPTSTPRPLPAPKPVLRSSVAAAPEHSLAVDLEYTRSTTV